MKLWTIIKSDLIYHYKRILLNVIFLLIFTISVLMDLQGLNDSEPIANAFWPILVSIGSVVLVVLSYKISMKEERNRIFILLPVKLKSISYARLTAGALQLAGAFTYLLVVHNWLVNKWEPVTERVFYQFGAYTYIMSAILFFYYFARGLTSVKMILKVVLAATMIICCLLLLFLTDSLIFNIIPHYLLGLIYFAVGLFFYFCSGVQFRKQKSFLEKVLLS